MPYLAILIITVIFFLSSPRTVVAEEFDFEQAVCGAVREPLAFWLWQSMAGRSEPSHASSLNKMFSAYSVYCPRWSDS